MHAGQISLPGGQIHAGETPEQTASREFEEELGCPAAEFAALGRLSPLFIYGTNFYVTPCVAVAAQRPQFCPNPAEVGTSSGVAALRANQPGTSWSATGSAGETSGLASPHSLARGAHLGHDAHDPGRTVGPA